MVDSEGSEFLSSFMETQMYAMWQDPLRDPYLFDVPSEYGCDIDAEASPYATPSANRATPPSSPELIPSLASIPVNESTALASIPVNESTGESTFSEVFQDSLKDNSS